MHIQSHAQYVALNARLGYIRRSCVLFFFSLTILSIYAAWNYRVMPTWMLGLFIVSALIGLLGTFFTAVLEKKVVTWLRQYEYNLAQMYVLEHHRYPYGCSFFDAIVFGMVFERPTAQMLYFTIRPNGLLRYLGLLPAVEAVGRWSEAPTTTLALDLNAARVLREQTTDDPTDTVYVIQEDHTDLTFKIIDRMSLQHWRETRASIASEGIHFMDYQTLRATASIHKESQCTTPSTSPTDSSESATKTISL